MNEKTVYWIWLQQALRYNNLKIKYIMNLYEDIERFYILGENEWRLLGIFTNSDIESLKKVSIEKAKIILNNCTRIGCEVVAIDDERFPYLLKQIEDPPAVLYVSGDISCMNEKLVVAVVGTRKASLYGIEMAGNISKTLAENDVVVVSGGALGIDSAAHEGAVAAGGKTVCVLGCGLDFPYLASKISLKRDIIRKGGAVITEYPPGTPARTWTFPARNRIISGLSRGTVVVEAGRRSGSLITANLANEQNRDVFVVAPPNGGEAATGNIALINDGAQVITSGADVLKEYSARTLVRNGPAFSSRAVSGESYELKHELSAKSVSKNYALPKKEEKFKIGPAVSERSSELKRELSAKSVPKNYAPPKKEVKIRIDPRAENLNEDERKVYEAVSEGIIKSDEIIAKTGVPEYKIFGVLTTLELLGLIKSLPGKYYEIL